MSTQFSTYQKPAQERIVNAIINGANDHLANNQIGEKHLGLSSFYWIHMDCTDPLTKAVTAKLAKTTTRIFNNYRGSKKAWYLCSQNDSRVIASFERAVAWLEQQGVKCYLCSEYD
jgi:hypothetical protein